MTKEQQAKFLIDRIVDKLTQMLSDEFGVDIPTALNVVYNSKTYGFVKNTNTDLYVQSAAYVYELLRKEYLTTRLD